MTIITHDDGTGARVHVAYEGPYPWDDGALEKAGRGEDGWKVYRGAVRAEYLCGDLLAEWDAATGTRLVPIPTYEPTETEKLNAEMGELQARIELGLRRLRGRSLGGGDCDSCASGASAEVGCSARCASSATRARPPSRPRPFRCC